MNEELVIPEQDLPDWIRAAKRGVDWGILAVLVLSIAIGWSFLLYDGLSRSSANENYFFRTADTAQALLEGRLYPRWSPHAFYGYGAPVLNYYPPAPTYLGAILTVLFTNDPTLSVRLVYVLCFCLAGGATYALLLRKVNAKAGIISALLYVYSPFLGLVAPHVLGDLQTVMGMALLPSWIWALDRVLLRSGAIDFLLLALATASLLLCDPTHYATATFFLGIPYVGLYIVQTRSWRRVWVPIGAVLMGLGLASFYWLPALAEINAVTWYQLSQPTSYLLTLDQFFSPVRQLDPSIINPIPQFALGWSILLFALASAIIMLGLRQFRNIHGLFLACGVALCGIAWIILPDQVWLLGLMTFCFSVSGSGLLLLSPYLRRRKLTRQFFVLSVVGVIILSLNVWESQRRVDRFGDISPSAQIRYEQQGFGIAVLPNGSLIPSNLPLTTAPNSQLLFGYQNDSVNRLQAEITITDQLSLIRDWSHEQRYQVRLPAALSSRVLLSDFVGWTASVDGRGIPLTLDANTDGMELTIPQSTNSELVIRLDDTPIRQLAWGISWGSLLSVLLITWWNSRHHYPIQLSYNALLHIRDTRLLAVAMLVLAIIGILGNTEGVSKSLRIPAGNDLSLANSLNSPTNASIEPIAYQLVQTEFSPGQSISVMLYWRATRTVDENYHIRLFLNDVEKGQTIFVSETSPIGNYPSKRWQQNGYVIDSHTLRIPSTVSSGRYVIALRVFPCNNRNNTCNESNPITFFDRNGIRIGTQFTIPRILTINQ